MANIANNLAAAPLPLKKKPAGANTVVTGAAPGVATAAPAVIAPAKVATTAAGAMESGIAGGKPPASVATKPALATKPSTVVSAPALATKPATTAAQPLPAGAEPVVSGTPAAVRPAATSATGATPSAPGAAVNTPAQAGVGAQTVSATPGANPSPYTTNQGAQDALRNTLMDRMLQSPDSVDMSNPAIRGQIDTFNAAAERARRDASADSAEANAGPVTGGAAGAQNNEQRLINEKASQARAGFETQLAASELQNQRDEIANALESMKGLITGDQERALQDKLGQLDAQIKQAGIASSERMGMADLKLKDKLGMAGLNLDLQKMLLQNKQFNNQLGFDASNAAAGYNQQALLALLR